MTRPMLSGYNSSRLKGIEHMRIVTATEMQNNFGRYLQAVQNGDEIIVLKNGKSQD